MTSCAARTVHGDLSMRLEHDEWHAPLQTAGCFVTWCLIGSDSCKANIRPQPNHVLWHGKHGVLSHHSDVAVDCKAHSKPHPDAIAEGDVGDWAVDNVTHQAVFCLKDLQCSSMLSTQMLHDP